MLVRCRPVESAGSSLKTRTVEGSAGRAKAPAKGEDEEIGENMDARRFKEGDRIRLISMRDDPCPVAEGTLGTVTGVCPPPINVVYVEWDDGRTLNVCPDVDEVVVVGREGGK